MTPFAFLGLAEDADERAIKSAYAKRLREVRPDRDPAGFQQLHTAYKAALEMSQARGAPARLPLPPIVAAPVQPALSVVTLDEDENDDEPVHDAGAPTPPMPAPAAAPPAFDVEQFFDRLRMRVRDGGAAEITPWLQGEPAFWSLAQKAGVRQMLLNRLDQERVPMPVDCFDALLAFFDLDHVLAGVDAFALQRLRRQLHLQWELLPEKFAQLASRMRRDPPAVSGETELRDLLNEAVNPLTWSKVLNWAGQPRHAVRFAVFAQRLSYGQPAELPREFNQKTIRFWMEAASTREPTWRTLGMAALHSLAWSLLGGVAVAFSFLKRGEDERSFALVVGGLMALGAFVYFGVIAWRALLRWLSQREHRSDPAWRYWLKLGLIPTLAVAGAALGVFVDPLIGAVPVLVALAPAYDLTLRLGKLQFGVGGKLVGYVIVAGFSLGSSVRFGSILTAALAIAGWTLVCYKKFLYRRL
jgi:hypothetical protein